MRTLNDCNRHAETQREKCKAGLGRIEANDFKSGLLDIPSYRSISIMNSELLWADGAGTMTKMVPIDTGGHILTTYGEFVKVFSKDKPETLLLHRLTNHVIYLEPCYTFPSVRIYNLLEFKLRMLKCYMEANLADCFIQWSSSPAAAPILFAKKQDGGLRLSVDYRALNVVTLNNRYPLQLVSEMLDRVCKANIFK